MAPGRRWISSPGFLYKKMITVAIKSQIPHCSCILTGGDDLLETIIPLRGDRIFQRHEDPKGFDALLSELANAVAPHLSDPSKAQEYILSPMPLPNDEAMKEYLDGRYTQMRC